MFEGPAGTSLSPGGRRVCGRSGGPRVRNSPPAPPKRVDGRSKRRVWLSAHQNGSLGFCSGCMAVYITEVSVKFCPSKKELTQEVNIANLGCLAKCFPSVCRQSGRLNLTANSRTTGRTRPLWTGLRTTRGCLARVGGAAPSVFSTCLSQLWNRGKT